MSSIIRGTPRVVALAALTLALAVTAACGADPTPTAAPAPIATPTPTALPPGVTPEPTPVPPGVTLEPTALPPGVTPVPTEPPPATPTPVPTPTGPPHYEGKTVRVIVGWGPGSNSDIQARYVVQRLGEFIPGNPRFVMTAVPTRSAYFNALNRLFDGPGDGLTMAYGVGGSTVEELVFAGEVQFKANEFQRVFSFDLIPSIWYAHKDSPYTSIEDMIGGTAEFTYAAAAEGDSRWTQMTFLKQKLDLPMDILTGFDGSTPGSFLTMDRHDADTVTSGFWYRLGLDRPGWLTDGYVIPMAIMSDYSVAISPNSEGPLPAGIPNIRDFLSEEEVREYNAMQSGEGALQRTAVMSRNTPDEIRAIISNAMVEAFADADFRGGLELLLGRGLTLVDGPTLDELASAVDANFLDEVYRKYSPVYESPF
ncbi:MAG: hypothetical protein OXL97_11895 [Chloroflexota bacterium]|nr:hypothetical protein [Chloroflexota bacterium]MDE2885175.1 hypothetical protein [Chloroflexota bacterium]